MKISWTSASARLALVAGALWMAAGCTTIAADAVNSTTGAVSDAINQRDVKSHAVRSIKTVTINRIAVMPLVEDPTAGEPLAPGAAEAISAELYSQVAMAGGWDPIPAQDVDAALQKMPPTTFANLDENALKLGHDVSADGVLYGTVERYKERVGADYAAASPASVSFSLKFVDLKSKQVVWTAKFAKSQAALSQNLFDLANFVQRSGRWVRAHEIAAEGAKEAVADLHGELNLSQNVKRFETGTYGELKSGQQRYNTGPERDLLEGQITLFNVKPAVGFTLPSAGVTPAARSGQALHPMRRDREMSRTTFHSHMLGRRVGNSRPLLPASCAFFEPRAGRPRH